MSGVMLVFSSLLTLADHRPGVALSRGHACAAAAKLWRSRWVRGRAGKQQRTFNLRRCAMSSEEIAIASGVSVPKPYVLEHEASINASPPGIAPSDAVVAVPAAHSSGSTGTTAGVIAHGIQPTSSTATCASTSA
jgi:hypothetical protein